MKYELFKNLFSFSTKSKIKAGDGLGKNEGKYPLYTSSKSLTKSFNDFQFEKESLIFGTGGLASIHYENERFSVSTDCFVVKPELDNFDVKFVYHYLNGNIHILEEGFKGAGLKHISKNYIENIKIPLPPLSQQKAIAEKLDKADALRKKDQELLAKYDELAQSLFIYMFGDPVKNEKGWEKENLEKLGNVGSSRRVFVNDLVNRGIPFYRGTEIGKMGAGQKIIPTLFITKEHYEILKAESGVPKIGDLLLPSICPDGRIWEVVNDEPFYYKDGRVLYINVDNNKCNSTFLKNVLKGIFYTEYSKISSGSTFAELKIFILKKIPIIIPPLSLQIQFAKKVKNIEAQKSLLKKQAQRSEDLFQALLQESFQ